MKIILCSVEDELTRGWEQTCGDLDFVEIYEGSILKVQCDAIVSPANSFGFMDGGIDALYMKYFRVNIQMIVRQQIYKYHSGELLVGIADIVETLDEKIPFLIIAPTMRVPMMLSESVNPYLAARGIFLLLKQGHFLSGKYEGEKVADHVKTIAIPGLGTGTGCVRGSVCGRQVRKAIDNILLSNYTMPNSWAQASERHQLLYTNKPRRL